MCRSSATAIFLSLAWFSATAAAADWQTVANLNGERVDIDKSRILRIGPGRTTAWARLSFGREMTDGVATYTTVQAMNRYDCEQRRFTTVRRIFLGGAAGDRPVRSEIVAHPEEMAAAPGSIDDQLLTEACRLRTVGEAQQVADSAAQAIDQARARPLHADLRGDQDQQNAHTIPVADTGKPELKSETKAESKPEIRSGNERPRFINLPVIDKSQVEDPYKTEAGAEGKRAGPTEAKSENKSPAKSEAKAESKSLPPPTARPVDKSVAERLSQERQYATSGPRRAAVPRPKPVEVSPEPMLHGTPWAYEGEGAPANWARLRPDYGICATGKRQSPIDIREGIRVDLEPIKFDYRPSLFRIVDNGHTVEVVLGEGNSLTIMGRSYRLRQFHFHRPAEERINGRGYDMDVHLVHQDEEGRLAVVAVLLEKGPEHPVIQTLWNHMPLETNEDVTPAEPIDLNALLPENRAYYTYMGSLTTPPCTENVLWMVMKQSVGASAEQIGIFSRLYRNNARPIQPANGRLIKENR